MPNILGTCDVDDVFRALADPVRRDILDRLRDRNGQSLRELCGGYEITRQAVTSHLGVLEQAGLVVVVRRGRERLHYLNAAPINDVADRWIGRYDRKRAETLAHLKQALEDREMRETEFVYVTYIRTTPETLWRALTEPQFIAQYFEGTGPESDWEPGSPVRWRAEPDVGYSDWGQVVLESEPNRRLSYTWHNYQPEMQKWFDWSDERLAELQGEPITKVTFEIEPEDGRVKLTVTHDGFAGETEMYKGVREGWPAILSNLKTVLESIPTESAAGDRSATAIPRP